MKKILKEQKGFAATDALIAVLIIALFSTLIGTLSYNIYLANSSIKRVSKATSYIVDVFEYIDKINYDSVTEENLINYFNKKYYYQEDEITPKENAEIKAVVENEIINVPYKVEIDIEKYNELDGNENKLDLVQEITMKVKYKLGNKDQDVTMITNKTKE